MDSGKSEDHKWRTITKIYSLFIKYFSNTHQTLSWNKQLSNSSLTSFIVCTCRCGTDYCNHREYPRWFLKVIITTFFIFTCFYFESFPRGASATVAEGNGFLFLPPAFRFLKYCKTTEYKCIEQNLLELWYDLKRYSAWKRNFPASSLWWSTRHPQLAEWLDSEYYRLRVYFVDDN